MALNRKVFSIYPDANIQGFNFQVQTTHFHWKIGNSKKKIHAIQLVVSVASIAEFFKPNFESVVFLSQLLVKKVLPDLKLYFK